ncbi:MAG: pseudouridine-5'-phosphate glycosidase, partial [Gaiellales bacterium]
TEDEAAAMARQHGALERTRAIVRARPPSDGFARSEAEEVIAAAVEDARAARVVGQELTPFVLDRVYERTDGRSAEVNRRLIAENARLAARVAVAYAAGAPDEPCGARGARR